MANYERPAFAGPNFKAPRGSLVLEREAQALEAAALEKREKAKAKRRDGHKCRWPEPHKCRLALESAHIQDASLGGPMAAENLVTLCGWLHRRGPESIHGKQLRIDKETAAGANGALSFWRQNLDGNGYYLVAREIAPFVIEKD